MVSEDRRMIHRKMRSTGSLDWTGLTPFAFPRNIAGVKFRDRLEAPVSTIEKTSWQTLNTEKMSDTISRQMISGENATVAKIILARGAIVPRHSHVNEQYSWVLSGSLKFIFDDREIVVGEDEVLTIPPNAPHTVVALEDTVDIDIFCPRR